MIAGHETTATALVWTVHELSRNATIAERLHAEVEAMFQQNPDPGYSEIERLPYLSNFTRELLRIHQSSVNAPREAIEDVVIQGTTIPKGTTVLMVMASMNRKKSIWGEDADVFDPDRWDRLEGTPASDPHAFQTFLWGPRGCIGRAFAMLELKVVVVELVRRFRFESIGDKDRTIALQSPSPLMKPKDPLVVKAERWD
jgi:cytochrome P450